MMRTITIKGGPAPAAIQILDADDKDITRDVRNLTVHMDGIHLATASLTFWAKVDVNAEVDR